MGKKLSLRVDVENAMSAHKNLNQKTIIGFNFLDMSKKKFHIRLNSITFAIGFYWRLKIIVNKN